MSMVGIQHVRHHMDIVERILGKIVGEEIAAEELEMVAGGLIEICAGMGGYVTRSTTGGGNRCDFD